MENRNGLLVDLRVAEANGTAEREVALEMMDDRLAGARNVTPHIAQNISSHRSSAVDGRTTPHAGYTISQRIRKRVEEIFGWTKTVANFRRTRFKGPARTELASYLVGAAYNLLRMGRLLAATA
jgi:hypothetical protein